MFESPEMSDARSGAAVQYDYGIGGKDDKKSNAYKPPMFSGEAEKFSWWKSKMYSHIMGIDDELWDILEDGFDIPLDEEGRVIDRMKLIDARKKNYRKRDKVSSMIVDVLPHVEYLKLSDKTTAKAMFNYLCSTY